MEYLRPRQEYVDLYDQLTVERCRNLERSSLNINEQIVAKGKKIDKKEQQRAILAAHNLFLYFVKGEEYERKERTIEEWMERDRVKDELLASADAKQTIRCLTCQQLMTPTLKQLYDWGDGPDRVLITYDCPDKHLPRRSFFHNGEEYVRKPRLCPKCNGTLKVEHTRKGQMITTTETCTGCSYLTTDTLDLRPSKQKIDKDFAKDRKRFCLSEKEGQEFIRFKASMEDMKKFMQKHEEREKNKETYDEVEKIQKLTVVQLEGLLTPIFEKEGYTRLQFGAPDMGKDLYLPFTTYDTKPDRKDRDSSYTLQKTAKKALESTNWRLMSDGISYRSGILTGRFRAYEREEDLLKLVSKKK